MENWRRITPILAFLALLAWIPGPGAGAADRELRLVVLGDSLVAGYGLSPGEAFPERLEAALRANGRAVKVENAGVSGDTSSGGLARLDWSVPEGTDAVILELGANDALRGIPPELTRKNLETIIERLAGRGIKVFLAGMLAPPNMGADYEKAFNAIYPELAQKHGLAFYPFFLDGVAAEPELNLDDAMHPNAAGIERITALILPSVTAFLDSLAS